jgi:hypothetical protein
VVEEDEDEDVDEDYSSPPQKKKQGAGGKPVNPWKQGSKVKKTGGAPSKKSKLSKAS